MLRALIKNVKESRVIRCTITCKSEIDMAVLSAKFPIRSLIVRSSSFIALSAAYVQAQIELYCTIAGLDRFQPFRPYNNLGRFSLG